MYTVKTVDLDGSPGVTFFLHSIYIHILLFITRQEKILDANSTFDESSKDETILEKSRCVCRGS